MNTEMGAHHNQIRVAHLNTVSIPKHRDEIQRVMHETDLDILCTSETNIKSNTPPKRFNIPGYKFIKQNHEYGPKGRIGIFFKETYKPKKI